MMNPSTLSQLNGRHHFFWFVLLLGTTVLGFYIFAGLMIFRYGTLTKDFGWKYVSKEDWCYISEVDPHGPAAGRLQEGDRVLALNDDTRIRVAVKTDVMASSWWAGTVWLKLSTISPESSYTIRVARGSAEHQFELKATLRRDYRNFGHIFSRLIVSVAFYIIALLVGILKPGERITQLFCVSWFATSNVFLSTALGPLSSFFHGFELTTHFLIRAVSVVPVHLALLYNSHYNFPSGIPRGRFWSLLKYLLYLWGALLLLLIRVIEWVATQGEQLAIAVFFNHYHFLKVLLWVYGVFFFFSLIAMCAVLARNYRLVHEPDQSRRLKWFVYGLITGVLPICICWLAGILLLSFRYGYILASNTFVTIGHISTVSIIIIPIASGYAITKHRLLDINVVIRRSLQYLLAKNFLQVILFLPVAGLIYTVFSNPSRTVAELFFDSSIYFYLLAIASLSLKFRRQLREWLDRKFFREACDQEKVLLELSDQIKQLDSISEISREVSSQLESAFHPKGIYIFYLEEEKYGLTLAYSSSASLNNLWISEDSELLRTLEGEERALAFPFSKELPQSEKAWLDELGINLIVPMNGTDHHLIGLLLLGEKRSEEPYTANDQKLLEAIVGQIAVVYENILLKGHVDKERKIKREVLARFEEQNINLMRECPNCGACYDSSVQFCDRDKSELTLSLPVERTIEGKYRLDRLIGKGGMGAVYEARDLRLNRKIAIKIIRASMFGDQEALRRFEREARTTARLNHPNIITIHDYGRLSTEGAYLVMEFVHGFTLRSELSRVGHLNSKVAAEWFDQLLDGVNAAHQEGIIHRDLKPENILISRQENGQPLIKILDFGLAKISLTNMTEQNTLTAPGRVMGTLGYMSPEQLAGEKVDERTDIFSLGAMVVEALTGQCPFRGRTAVELLASILKESFHLEGDSKEVERLDEVLQRCLAKDPMKRFAFVAEMQRELIPAIRNCSIKSREGIRIHA